MSQFFQIHPENPQDRLLNQAADIINQGKLAVIPTDCAYAIACLASRKTPTQRLRRIRQLEPKHNLTLICRDFSELSCYAKVDNQQFRLLKAHTPGAYTFILPATKEVPKLLMHPKKKTIGMRVPDNKITLGLLEKLDGPLISASLILPHEELPLSDPYEIRDRLESQLDLIIDGGFCGFEATSVIDMTTDVPSVLRQGIGDISAFK